MNLEELITLIFKKINDNGNDKKFTKAEIREIYKVFIEVLEERLESETSDMENKKEIKINIPLIGKFNIVRQNSYMGRNQENNKKSKIKSRNKIYFYHYKTIKKSVNKK